MNYDLKHLGSMPPASVHPAYASDAAAYLLAVVVVAANDGTPTAPPGTRANLRVRPAGEIRWLYCSPVDDLTVTDIENAFAACIIDPDEDRMESDIQWMTAAEVDALPDFDGW
jgi:hypothetical protein